MPCFVTLHTKQHMHHSLVFCTHTKAKNLSLLFLQIDLDVLFLIMFCSFLQENKKETLLQLFLAYKYEREKESYAQCSPFMHLLQASYHMLDKKCRCLLLEKGLFRDLPSRRTSDMRDAVRIHSSSSFSQNYTESFLKYACPFMIAMPTFFCTSVILQNCSSLHAVQTIDSFLNISISVPLTLR